MRFAFDRNKAMFIDKVPNRGSRPTILIRESYREGGKVRKRTIANITNLPEDMIEQIRSLLRGSVVADAPGGGLSGAFSISRSLPHGNAAAALAALRACGIDKAIDPRRSPARDLAIAMVVQRLLKPESELAPARSFCRETASSTLSAELELPEVVSEERLYEVIDWLLRRQPRIEKALAEKFLADGKPALYDLTSTGSYSRYGDQGPSRIEFGLLYDLEGRPVAIEALSGNASSPSTVSSQARKLRDRFRLKRVVFAGDRGMTAQARIRKVLGPKGFDWIFALRAPALHALAENGALQPSLLDECDMAEFECGEMFPGERLVVYRTPHLAQQRASRRRCLIAATENELAAVQSESQPLGSAVSIRRHAEKILERHKTARHFELKIDEGTFSWKRRNKAISVEEALDEFDAVGTSVPKDAMPAAEAVLACKNLGTAKRVFRTMKAFDLEDSPVRQDSEHWVRAHLLICMLACHVEMHMRKVLAPMLFDDEDDPVRDPSAAKTERSPKTQRKVLSSRARSRKIVRNFRDLLRHLEMLTMNRITPAGSEGRGFDRPTSPTPIQDRALRLLNVDLGEQ